MRISLYFQVLVNVIRFSMKRIIYGKRFCARLIQRVSLLASIDLHEQGSIRLGYNLDVSPWCSFLVTGRGVLEIGDRVYFNRGCMISCHQKVTIGKGSIFGPGVKIFDNDHVITREGLDLSKHKTGEITIGEGTWVASDVVILRGTHIGSNCLIGAGTVVKGIIPDNSRVIAERKLTITPMR